MEVLARKSVLSWDTMEELGKVLLENLAEWLLLPPYHHEEQQQQEQ